MCAAKPPQPKAPPPPTPQRDINIEARAKAQDRAALAADSGYESTLGGAPPSPQAATNPVLGG